jgi:hypothetical protein
MSLKKYSFRKMLTFAVAFFLIPGLIQAIDLTGNITTNRTLSISDSPVNITGNVTVYNGATLTIEAGVVINFTNRSYHIYAGNSTSSLGTINASGVIFNGLTGDAYENYIHFRYGSTGNITNCTFNNAEIVLTSSSPTVTNSSFSDCKYMMKFINNCSPVLTGLTVASTQNPGIAIEGTISSDFTLNNYGFPYFLTNTLTVRDGAN